MIASRLALAALTLVGPLGYAAPADAGLLTPAEQSRVASQVDNRPMVFFVAKGVPGSCGPGCDEWIAAEGSFLPGTPQRLRDLLNALGGRDLPIFFHSRGGFAREAREIGGILRERRMTTGVGRTIAERCRVFSPDDAACQNLIKSGTAVKARLLAAEGRCLSACLDAFAGGSIRRLPSGSILGVHSPWTDAKLIKRYFPDAKPAGELNVDDAHRRSRRYLVDMGIDPRLIDVSAQVSPRRMYVLSREEITRFGIETRGFYETAWSAHLDSSKRPFLQKAITQPTGAEGKEHLTSSVRLLCVNGTVWFLYRRERPPTEIGIVTGARVTAGDQERMLGRGATRVGAELHSASPNPEFLRHMAAAPGIVITEANVVLTRESTQNGLREIKLSTSGLSKPLEQLLKECGELKLLSSAGG